MKQKLLLLVITVLSYFAVCAQNKTVTGTVLDATDGLPLPGVSIKAKGGTQFAQTNNQGVFSIAVPQNVQSLVFSFVGYAEQEVKITGRSLTVKLSSVAQKLSEVVVVAYGQSTKEAITGAVTSISAKDIEKRPITNTLAVIEGAAPGIQVNNTAGQPGSEPAVRIRGFSSLTENSPLYVIDGVPFGGNVADINPNDIESVSVLKDASASSLYGNRASNGVIILTTKKGKGTPSLNFSSNQGYYSRGIAEYDRMGPDQFMETMWQGFKNSLRTSNPAAYPTEAAAAARATSNLISDYLLLNIYNKPAGQLFDSNGKLVAGAQILPGYADDLDWFTFERKGYRQDYNVNASSSTDKSSLYFSTGYLNEKGYIKKSNYSRFSGRVNASFTPKSWIKSGFNLSGSHQRSNYISASAASSGSYKSPYWYARTIAPIYPVHLHNITTGEYILDDSGMPRYDDGTLTRKQYVGRHTIWENELDEDFDFRNTLNGQGFVDIKFLKDFTFTVKGDLNVRNNEEQTYNNAIIGDGSGNNGRAQRIIYRYKNYTAQQLLNWNKAFGQHHVDVLAGHENYSYNYNYLNGYKTTETFAGKTELINFTDIVRLTDYQVNYRTEGYLSRAKYDYNNIYYVDASFRRDASSRFSRTSRWGNFWSLGGAWLVSKENFFQPLASKINNLKLRASYGEVGNDAAAGYYAYMALYDLRQNANRSALTIGQNANEDLIWETSSSSNAALEGRIFNRANFVIEYFDKRSQNLLFDVNLPLSAGGTSTTTAESVITKNIGSISNRGLELTFDVDVVKNQNWGWNVGANATFMKNKIVRLPEENRQNGIVSGLFKRVEGRGIYDFWTYQYVGVDQMTGDALYLPDTENYNVNGSAPTKTAIPAANLVQINGNYYTNFNTYAKRDWSGSAIPKVFGSFSTQFRYKDLSLSGLFTYALGGKTFDYAYQDLVSMSGTPGSLHTDLLKAWNGVPAGMTATSADRIDPKGTPVVDFARSDRVNGTSTRFLQDGSYLVIKNIALNYRVPKTLLGKLDISSLSLNLGVENLATFTKLKGMNPQQAFNGTNDHAYITPRTVSFGINLGL